VPPKRLPSVVLVGRPNVGKSTLFNRLTATRRAIVAPVAGTTRDVLTYPVVWQDRGFELTDTGGMFGASQDPLHQLVFERGQRAIRSADVIIFVVDGREGLAHGDEDIAAAVRAANVPVLLAVNKTDDRRARAGALELYQLGFDPVFEVSAEHGHGVGELLDEVVRRLPGTARSRRRDADEDGAADHADHAGDSAATPDQPEVAVAIVGRPNAGKSSLVNRLLREERMIVSDVPGTTRDSVDTMLQWHRRQFRIVDTAGIRKAGKVHASGAVEQVSVMLARRAIERADVVVLVLDATHGATDQDAAIGGDAHKAGRGVIIAANKWDLMKEQGPDAYKEFDERVRYQLKFLEYAPILHISAKSGERTPKLLEAIDKVAASRRMRVPTGELNRFIAQITSAHLPVSPGRRSVRVLYAAQTNVAPPTFVMFTNVATKLHFSYERFLENQLREKYGFFGTPLKIVVRRRGKAAGDEAKR
jgi:GTP-binding protein